MGTQRLRDDQLENLVTAYWMREYMSCTTIDGRRDHPLILPAGPDTPVLIDYTKLRLPLPFKSEDLPRGIVGEMLKPLAELCAANAKVIPLSIWTYDWFYLELLDWDGRLSPLCWISAELLDEPLLEAVLEAGEDNNGSGKGEGERRAASSDDEAENVQRDGEEQMGQEQAETGAAGLEQHDSSQIEAYKQLAERIYQVRVQLPLHRLSMRAMDWITQPDEVRIWPVGDRVTGERERWRQLFRKLWRANEEKWVRQGLLRFDSAKPWLQMIALDRRALPEEGETSYAKSWEHGFRTGSTSQPWLRWKMIPLYDARDIYKVREAMKRELFVTSIFNWLAKPRQNPHLWRTLEQRFALKFQRSSYLAYRSELRRRKVLEWTLQGKSINETARLLIENDLHPLDEYEIKHARARGEDVFELYFDAARRIVIRLRAEFRQQGKIPKGRPGHRLPIKQPDQQAPTD